MYSEKIEIPCRAEPTPQRVEALGPGGALLLFTVRVWVDAFVAGCCPPPCLARAFPRLGCPDVPAQLLCLLRLLRQCRDRRVLFHGPGQASLTDSERWLLEAVAAAAAGAPATTRRQAERLAGPALAPAIAQCAGELGRALAARNLPVWADTPWPAAPLAANPLHARELARFCPPARA